MIKKLKNGNYEIDKVNLKSLVINNIIVDKIADLLNGDCAEVDEATEKIMKMIENNEFNK